MKRFIKNTLIFSLMMITGLGILELYARHIPSIQTEKREMIISHKDKITTLILGSSHSFWGINPDAVAENGWYNLAYIAQGYQTDYFLLKKYLPMLPNLKRVVLPVSYFSFFDKLDMDDTAYFICSESNIQHDLQIKYKFGYSNFTISHPQHFRFKLLPWRHDYEHPMDSLGMGTERKWTATSKFNMNSAGSAPRHTAKDWTQLNKQLQYFNDMISLCKDKNIEIILVTTPCSPGYRKATDKRQLSMTNQIIDSVCRTSDQILYFNYFADERFTWDDFFDADHLNCDVGAVKLTHILFNDMKHEEKRRGIVDSK